jgi:L-seryl-tRNA(Ser) seleniumtransferase
VGRGDDTPHLLRNLPAVHELAATLEAPHALAVTAARRAIDEQRDLLQRGERGDLDVAGRARELLDQLGRPSLRRVINATGVIIHTNLGRAPLAAPARAALAAAAEGYSNLELELERGERGSRHSHVEPLLCELTGAEAAIAVNNGAAAVLLAVAALAGPERDVIVSRGQLIEIGGGFRIPEVVEQSGARLVEVGTTNRTRLRDYVRAIERSGDRLGAILRVHQSNFRAQGFVEEVEIEALCGLGVPVIDDVGSGVLADIAVLADEPPIERSVTAGASLVCCSGDKLLGGPQAGVLAGRSEAVAAAREHPLARAVRIDKLSLAALEATLLLYRDPSRARTEIPVLAMLDCPQQELAARAQRLRDLIGEGDAEIVRAIAKVGGGALPLLELEGPAVALRSSAAPADIARALRQANPPVIGRIHEGHVLLDPRTLRDEDLEATAAASRTALEACGR